MKTLATDWLPKEYQAPGFETHAKVESVAAPAQVGISNERGFYINKEQLNDVIRGYPNTKRYFQEAAKLGYSKFEVRDVRNGNNTFAGLQVVYLK